MDRTFHTSIKHCENWMPDRHILLFLMHYHNIITGTVLPYLIKKSVIKIPKGFLPSDVLTDSCQSFQQKDLNLGGILIHAPRMRVAQLRTLQG